MAEKKTKAITGTACPQCGGTLAATPALEKRAMVKAMIEGGASAPYANNFADSHHEKQDAEGVVHVCGGCRYVTRIKAAA